MRHTAGLFALAALFASPALAQQVFFTSPAPAVGFGGQGHSSPFTCAQCGGQHFWAVQAKPGDVRVGHRVLSIDGSPIGRIVAADAKQAVVATPATMVRVPKEAFGKSANGLVLRVSRAKLEQMALALQG
jgi:hypothetical protein